VSKRFGKKSVFRTKICEKKRPPQKGRVDPTLPGGGNSCEVAGARTARADGGGKKENVVEEGGRIRPRRGLPSIRARKAPLQKVRQLCGVPEVSELGEGGDRR